MAKKRGRARSRRPSSSKSEEKRPRNVRAAIAAGAVAIAVIGSGLAVDSGADSSFDAPKRLTAILFIGLAAALLSFSPWRSPFRREDLSSPGGLALLFTAAAIAWALLSALLSPHRAAALDATRVILLFLLLLPIAASRALEGRGGSFLLGTFLVVASLNAAVSLLQARGLYHPFALKTEFGGRESTGAFVGNVGYLAMALALAAVAALAILFFARRVFLRVAAGAGVLLFASGLLVNRNLTSLTALLAGSAILFLAVFRRRALLPAAALALAIAIGSVAYSPMRGRLREAGSFARAGDWNRLLTYRVGAWKAAIAMARERPLFGYGPGTFGTEFIPHRLAAEIASNRRYDNPLRTSSYSEAHCDYLQPFAETGVPGGLLVLGAVGCLFVALTKALRQQERNRWEVVLLMAVLGAGATAALTWFPLQRPVSSIPLLLAAGRAWRISRLSRGEQEP